MLKLTRVALSAAAFLCALGSVAAPAPTFASEAPTVNATAMLAAVTGPLLAVNVQALQHPSSDFSTAGAAQSSASDPQADPAEEAHSLSDLIAQNEAETVADDELRCLATSVYYESKGEPADGQLAVAQTILNRTQSSRFPSSVCGVVREPGQFSFVRHGTLPEPPHNAAWRRAVAVAVVAVKHLWHDVAPKALYFHARRVSPGWGLTRVASIGQQVFFR